MDDDVLHDLGDAGDHVDRYHGAMTVVRPRRGGVHLAVGVREVVHVGRIEGDGHVEAGIDAIRKLHRATVRGRSDVAEGHGRLRAALDVVPALIQDDVVRIRLEQLGRDPRCLLTDQTSGLDERSGHDDRAARAPRTQPVR